MARETRKGSDSNPDSPEVSRDENLTNLRRPSNVAGQDRRGRVKRWTGLQRWFLTTTIMGDRHGRPTRKSGSEHAMVQRGHGHKQLRDKATGREKSTAERVSGEPTEHNRRKNMTIQEAANEAIKAWKADAKNLHNLARQTSEKPPKKQTYYKTAWLVEPTSNIPSGTCVAVEFVFTDAQSEDWYAVKNGTQQSMVPASQLERFVL